MLKYLKLYKTFITNCLMRDLEFRINFILYTVLNFLWTGLTYFSVFIIYGQVDRIGSWDKNEMLLFTTVFSFSNALLKLSLYQNSNKLSEYIRNGELDFLLSKPKNTRFIISTRYFKFQQIPRLLMFFYLIFLQTFKLNPQVNISSFFYGFILIFLGVFGMYCLLFIINSFAFWKPRICNLFALTDKLEGLADRPSDIYKGILKYLFTFFPIAAFSTIPAKFFLGKGTIELFIEAAIITVFFFCLSHIIWKLGLKRYESASS